MSTDRSRTVPEVVDLDAPPPRPAPTADDGTRRTRRRVGRGRAGLLVGGFALLGLALAAAVLLVRPATTTLVWQASFSAATGPSSPPIANADLLSTRGRTIAYLASADSLVDRVEAAHPDVRGLSATYVNGTNVVELAVSAPGADEARAAMDDYLDAVRTVAAEAAGVRDAEVLTPVGPGPSTSDAGLPAPVLLALGAVVPAAVVGAVLAAWPRLRAARR